MSAGTRGWRTAAGCRPSRRPSYLFAERELAFWTQKEKEDAGELPWITDSVLPIVAAKRADVVKSDHALNDLVQLIPTPGHTIDHFSVHVGKPGQDAVITGDMIHSPLQARYPELGMRVDYDSKQAGESRREMFGRFCDTLDADVHGAFPLAVDRPLDALGRRLQVHLS